MHRGKSPFKTESSFFSAGLPNFSTSRSRPMQRTAANGPLQSRLETGGALACRQVHAPGASQDADIHFLNSQWRSSVETRS